MENEFKREGVYLTPEEYTEQKKRFEYLVKVKRQQLADYIREAKEANISEGEAYEDALAEQIRVESLIKELERLLKSAEITTEEEPDSKK